MLHVPCFSHHTPYKTHYDLLIGQEAIKRVVAIMMCVSDQSVYMCA